jgi:hypothetical protein
MKRGTRKSNNGYIGYDQYAVSQNGIVGANKLYSARLREFPTYQLGNTANQFGINGGNYQRPSDWPALPSVTAGSQQIAGLFAVFNNESNICAVQIQGAYNVNWGDGTTGAFSSNSVATKRYDQTTYAGLTSSIVTSRGGSYKTVLITITPQTGQNFSTVNFAATPTGITGLNSFHSTNWLDIRMAGNVFGTVNVSNWYSTGISSRMLEQFEFVGPAPISGFSFISCTSLKKIVAFPSTATMSSWGSNFHTCYALEEIPASLLDGLVTGRASGAANYVFYACNSFVDFPVAAFNTRNLTTMTGFFQSCSNLRQSPRIDTSSCTNLNSIYYDCCMLEEIPYLDTRRNTDFGSMFAVCTNLRTIQSELLGASGTAFNYMFNGTKSLKTIPKINTSNGTNFQGMFNGAASVQTIPQYDYSKATDLSFFGRYSGLNTLPTFNTTSALTNTSYMFDSCGTLQTAPSITNMSNVTNTQFMFNGCWSLRTIPSITMGNVTTSGSMFTGTQALLSVGMTGISFACNFTSSMMGPTALNDLFSSLATVGASGANARAITITGNWGASSPNINRSIAIGKGWQVTG